MRLFCHFFFFFFNAKDFSMFYNTSGVFIKADGGHASVSWNLSLTKNLPTTMILLSSFKFFFRKVKHLQGTEDLGFGRYSLNWMVLGSSKSLSTNMLLLGHPWNSSSPTHSYPHPISERNSRNGRSSRSSVKPEWEKIFSFSVNSSIVYKYSISIFLSVPSTCRLLVSSLVPHIMAEFHRMWHASMLACSHVPRSKLF